MSSRSARWSSRQPPAIRRQAGRQPALPTGERRRPREAMLDEVQRAARHQHPVRLAQRRQRIGNAAQRPGHHDRVDAGVRQRQVLGRLLQQAHREGQPSAGTPRLIQQVGAPGRPPADRRPRGRRAASSGRPRSRSRARGPRHLPPRAGVAAGGARPPSRDGSAAGRRPSRRSPNFRPAGRGMHRLQRRRSCPRHRRRCPFGCRCP